MRTYLQKQRPERLLTHRHLMGKLSGIVLLLCVLGATVPASANPLDAYGAGARAIGMGGAFTSLADDFSANYYNPAGLAQSEDIRLELGYLYMNPDLSFDGEDAGVDRVKGLQGGIVLPGEVLGVRFGAGIGLFILDDRITRVRALPQQQPRFVLFDNRVQRLFVAANLAFEPIDHLYIGGGVTFFASTRGSLNVEGRVSLDDAADTVLQGSIDVDIESNRYAQAGILYAPDAPWSVGLAFRDEFFLELALGTRVSGEIFTTANGNSSTLVEDASFVLASFNSNHFTPRSVVLGFSYDFGPLLVATDIGWHQWSHFPSPTSTVEIELDLGDLDFSIPPLDPVLDPNFVDLIVPRLGLEARAVDTDHFGLDVRGGYFFEDSPVPDQPGITNYADAARHGVSLGLGLSFIDFSDIFPKPLLLDFSFLYIRMVERTYLKDDPADLVGDYRIDGHFFGGGLMMSIVL